MNGGLVATRGSWLALLGFAGCFGPTEGEKDGLHTLADSKVTDNDGMATFAVPVNGEDGLLLTFTAEAPNLTYVQELRSPTGAVRLDADALWNDPHSVSNGAFPDHLATLNWPALPDDILESGDWEVDVGVVNGEYFYERSTSVVMEGQLKDDADLDDGILDVDVVYTADIIGDAPVIDAIEQAISRWEDIYSQIDIDLNVTTWEFPDIASLPPPGLGGTRSYEEIASQTPFHAVNLVIVPDLDGTNGLYGMAGNIPGPLFETGTSAVALSTNMHRGPDMVFSDDEIAILGETMAHEVGHFLGLFHPVESSFDQWDSLDDTPDCFDETSCIANLSGNLMFPYPVCDEDGVCIPQGSVTADQGQVTQRYTGVQ